MFMVILHKHHISVAEVTIEINARDKGAEKNIRTHFINYLNNLINEINALMP
jgi:hypothetical protein